MKTEINIKNYSILQRQFLKYLYYLSLLGILAAVGFYVYIVLNFSTNAPFFDDFFWGFSFLDEYLKSQNITEKIKLIFQQHAQHRIAYFRLFLVAHYHILGTIDFKNISIFANISNLIVFGLLFKILHKDLLLRYLLFPIALILFQFQFYQNIISSYGFPNMAVYMWVILAFYFNSLAGRSNLIITLTCAIFAVFSNGNGILSFPLIWLFLFLQNRFTDLKISAAVLGIVLILYFAFANDMATQPINLFISGNYFIKFLSAGFFTGHRKVEFVATLLMLFSFTVLFLKQFFQSVFQQKKIENFKIWLFLSPIILWILATSLSVALFRATADANIPNWYFNYSILFLIFWLIYIFISLNSKFFKIAALLIVTAYGLSNYYKNLTSILPTIHSFHSSLEADILNFKNHKKWSFVLTQVSYPMYKKFELLTNHFYQKGIYKPNDINAELTHNFEKNKMEKADFLVENSINNEIKVSFMSPKNLPQNCFGFIKSENEIYYFGVGKRLTNSKLKLFTGVELFENRPFFVIGQTYFDIAIKKGEYHFGFVFFDKNGAKNWYISEQKIQIKNY